MNASRSSAGLRSAFTAMVIAAAGIGGDAFALDKPPYNRTVVADVVAFDQPYLLNRLGASQPGGMIYALRGDVVPIDAAAGLRPGNVTLRPGKRPRPIALRMNVRDCLQINFQNLLTTAPSVASVPTRYAGVHVNGLSLLPLDLAKGDGIDSDASWVGRNPGASGSLAKPGESKVYKYIATEEGTFLLSSAADNMSGGNASQPGMGLFGAVNVQPEWAEWYRSQVSRVEMELLALPSPPVESPPPANALPVGVAPQGLAPMAEARVQPIQSGLIPANADAHLRTLEYPSGAVQAMAVTGRSGRMAILKQYDPDKRYTSAHEVMVVGGRLFSKSGQPLIQYNAAFGTGPGVPEPLLGRTIIKMLQPRPAGTVPLFTTTLTDDQIREALADFNRVPPAVSVPLSCEFLNAPAKIKLSDKVRVNHEADRSWLVTDPETATSYLVEQAPPPAGKTADLGQFRVWAATLHLVYSDLTAIITGPNASRFPDSQDSPTFYENPVYPDRRQPYREFTILYHRVGTGAGAWAFPFEQMPNINTNWAMLAGQDGFAINYGAAGIGPEIVANRIGVGPMGNADAVDLKYEEFFLSSWAVGDPAMIVDVPANAQKLPADARNQSVAGPAADGSYSITQKSIGSIELSDADIDNLNKINGLTVGGFIPPTVAQQLNTVINPPLSADARVIIAAYNSNQVGNEWLVIDPADPTAANRRRFPLVKNLPVLANGNTQVTVYSGFPAINVSSPAYQVAPAGATSTRATRAFYPDDPSNVYHSNMRDHVKFRILHAGPGPSHVHHQHAHQWLHSPNAAESQYLDSQLIVPGVAYTLEMVYGGSGNRNLTVGDSIFHCHFYPHFAQGMWSLWRVHDVFELGTKLDEATGRPEPGARALPDGEIELGTPIPGIVPLPTLAMAPMPAKVSLTDLSPFYPKGVGQGRRVAVEARNQFAIDAAVAMNKWLSQQHMPPWPVPEPEYDNPGYPFFIPGVAGHRPPHPPLDFAWGLDNQGKRIKLDGGLPRHVGLSGNIVRQYQTRWDFTRDFIAYDGKKPVAGKLYAMELPEQGTPVERGAMRTHATRTRESSLPNGKPGNFTLNGLPGRSGAPYAPPMVNDFGNNLFNPRRYQAAVIQTDVVLNKDGWHSPQQRFLTLWEDVADTIGGQRAPQPLFFRGSTNDAIEFWHTNLVPSYYELDDFQVRTPTDVIGQHIHNVKFDVTSSDGASNGFNYEDGTFSPDEVRDRIAAIGRSEPVKSVEPNIPMTGLLQFDDATGFVSTTTPAKPLSPIPVHVAYPPRNGKGSPAYGLFGKPPGNQDWDGAQTTIQLWDCDPLLDNRGHERTLRTIFTHDHLGPSTHQQVGLYAGLLTEPDNSRWFLPNGDSMYTRLDGGPTSWEGYIVTADPRKSYREFALEFQDTQLAYGPKSITAPSSASFDPANANPSAAFDVSQYASWVQRKVPDYVKSLNAGAVPTDFTAFLFPAMGIPLSDQATVQAQGQNTWVVTEHAPLNAGQSYTLKAARFQPDQVQPGVSVPGSILVYTPGIKPGWTDPANSLMPPFDSSMANFGDFYAKNGPPYPQLVSNKTTGTYSVNYRNEPALSRLSPPWTDPPNPPDPSKPLLQNIDPAYVFSSQGMDWADPLLNGQPVPNTPINPTDPKKTFRYPPYLVHPSSAADPGGVEPKDPFTPLLRAYANDDVEVRVLVGAHTQAHAFQIQGVRWSFEPGYPESGYRNAQGMGISEHFEMNFKLPPLGVKHDNVPGGLGFADYLYSPSSGVEGLSNGLWGIMRGYTQQVGTTKEEPGCKVVKSVNYLAPLPSNQITDLDRDKGLLEDRLKIVKANFASITNPVSGRPGPAKLENYRIFNVTATTAAKALGTPSLTLNPRGPVTSTGAVMFVYSEDLDNNGRLKPGAPVEPLILRVAAGDWVQIRLTNALPNDAQLPALAGTLPPPTDVGVGTPFQVNPTGQTPTPVAQVLVGPTRRVGLHPALVWYDVTDANGVNVGFNPEATLAPSDVSKAGSLIWYAGDLVVGDRKRYDGGLTESEPEVREVPIEYGAINLVPADLLVQNQFGMVGSLIVEPRGSTWVEDYGTRASATVTPDPKDGPAFRDFVLVAQNSFGGTGGIGAFNFSTEPFSARSANLGTPPIGNAQAFANSLIGANGQPIGDPVTPILRAAAGTPVRVRFAMPTTSTTNSTSAPFVFTIHGHGWQEEPFIDQDLQWDRRPKGWSESFVGTGLEIGHNSRSQFFGAQQVVPYESFNFVIDRSGGTAEVVGDFLYETFQQTQSLGTWGLFRVQDDLIVIEKATVAGGVLTLSGSHQPSRKNAKQPDVISVSYQGKTAPATLTGKQWTFSGPISGSKAVPVTVTSSLQGSASIQITP